MDPVACGQDRFVDGREGGVAPIAGVEPEFVEVVPIIGAFRRMVRDVEFDVCEMAPTTYMIARALGARLLRCRFS